MSRPRHHRASLSLPIARICTGAEEGAELLTQFYGGHRLPQNQKLLAGCLSRRLRRLEIDVCLDELLDRDIRALSAILPAVRMLTRIQLYGKCFTAITQVHAISEAREDPGGVLPPNDPLRMKKTTEKPNMWEKSRSDAHIDPGTVRLSRRPELVSPLLRSLSQHCSLNSSLVDLRLIGLKIAPTGWKSLSKGLQQSTSLEYVSLTYCKISDEDMAILSPALEVIPSLRKLDLSNNSLGNRSGFLIGRIISLHSQRRDDYLWAANLRRSGWDSDFSDPVLCELALANNHFDNFALCDICRVLSLDTWLRAIDLRCNPIGVEALRDIRSVLQSNRSLLIVDIRETPVDGRREVAEIVTRLKRNLADSADALSQRCFRLYQDRVKELAAACPFLGTTVTLSAPISQKTSPRRSSNVTRSPDSTTCCSPPSSFPSRPSKIDLKLVRKATFPSISASSRSKVSVSCSDCPTQASLKRSKTVERLSVLENLVSELTSLLDSIAEEMKTNRESA